LLLISGGSLPPWKQYFFSKMATHTKSNGPRDISTVIKAVQDMLIGSCDAQQGLLDAQQLLQELTQRCAAAESANNGGATTAGRVCESTFVTDENVDAISSLIPISAGYSNDRRAMGHEIRMSFAIFLLQATAGDTANAAAFLAAPHSMHPLRKLESSVLFARQSGQLVPLSTLKEIVFILVRLQSSFSLFCTEEGRQLMCQSGTASYSLDHHAVVAWNAIQKCIFADATDEASRRNRLEGVLSLDYRRLLAKVVDTLRDVLSPLQQQNDASHGARQFSNMFIRHTNRNFDSLASEGSMPIQGYDSEVPKQSQNLSYPHISSQNALQSQALRTFHHSGTTQTQASGVSSNRRTPTPTSSCDIAGITDRRFAGKVRCFNPEANFGFITCAQLQEVFDKDVWVHKQQLHGFIVGQLVSFKVVISNRGHPQAVKLLPLSCMEYNQGLCFSV